MGEMRQAEEARRLRVEEGLSGRQIQQRLGVPKARLLEWLRGVPPPEWTRRPNAKDALRDAAIALRQQGWSVNDIALKLNVAQSTSWRWVAHLPLDPDTERAKQKRARGKLLTDARWRVYREQRAERRAEVAASARESVGELDDRDLLLIGSAIYWCEGAKEKPWRRLSQMVFANTDLRLIRIFLAFLRSLGVPDDRIHYRVSIHETADASEAVMWWSVRLGLPVERFQRTTLKRHAPKTNRLNIGEDYHGCLSVGVRRAAELYWRIEGVVDALALVAALSVPADESD